MTGVPDADLAAVVGRGVAGRLAAAGIADLTSLAALNPRELAAVPGIGPIAFDTIRQALTRRGHALAADPWEPYVCARDGRAAADADLSGFFLCDVCRAEFGERAFSGTAPEWVSNEPVHGFCSHCNTERDDVRLTQWHLCGVCTRVLRSLGRGLAAARFVLEQWASDVAPLLPGVELAETDPPALQPRSKAQRAAKVSTADFTATDVASRRQIFGFELKSGKSAAAADGIGKPMTQFQLDTTDCDDILVVVRRENVPVYLVHAQVLGRATPPTERFAGVGLWWTDLWTMEENFRSIRNRALETRSAAYYRTSMFKPFATFAEHVARGGVERDQARLEEDGPPTLYATTRS